MLSKLLFILFIMNTVVQANWGEYKSLFVAHDGRVIDRVNSDITHSESIGYALYLSLKNDDIKTFDKIYKWYKDNLTTNDFGLISWKWGKDKNESWHILDKNNASDGDLWIAYDNLLMYEKTNQIHYKQEALSLIKNIKQHLIMNHKGRLYLLPAKTGFNTESYFEINLSYYLFFIFDKFVQYDNDTTWKRLKNDGINLLNEAKFSPLKLHSDWIRIDKRTLKIELTRNNSFGYDALRIPFNILKSDIKDKDKLLEPYIQYVNSMKSVDSVFGTSDLKNGTISLFNYSFAHLSIYNMLDKHFNNMSSFTNEIKSLKGKNKNDYYSYSIYLFTTFN
ncbi:hypothetical protein KJ877_08100 [bacterium]|nr:hypothetical protein [bacterium]MBU1990969.1 hypothetical protein [bacterium]